MGNLRQICVFLLALFLCTVIVSQSTWAAISAIKCDTTNGGFLSGSFIDPAEVSTTSCEEIDVKHVFSSVVCNFVIVLNEVFSKFYCSIQYAMKEILMAVIVVYVAVFGARMLIGTQEVNSGTVLLAVLKIGFIAEFANSGTLGVSMVYEFFIGLTIQAIDWAYGAIMFCKGTDLSFDFTACFGGVDLGKVFSGIDTKLYELLMGVHDINKDGTLDDGIFGGKGEMITLIFLLALLVPPLFQIILWLLWTTLSMFMRSVASFLMCVVAIAFLISLSPIFLSFALFNSTVRIFESWLRFLVSYSIQPMFIFAIFGMWLMIISDFVSFVDDLSKVMRYEIDDKHRGPMITEIQDELKFCRLTYGTKPPSISLSVSSMPISYIPGGPTIGCCPIKVTVAADGKEEYSCAAGALVDIKTLPPEQLVAPSVMIQESQFIYFLAYHLLAVTFIGYAFYQMLRIAPQIAQELSQSRTPAPLGAGFGGGFGLDSIASGLSRRGSTTVRNLSGKAYDAVRPTLQNGINRYSGQTGVRVNK